MTQPGLVPFSHLTQRAYAPYHHAKNGCAGDSQRWRNECRRPRQL